MKKNILALFVYSSRPHKHTCAMYMHTVVTNEAVNKWLIQSCLTPVLTCLDLIMHSDNWQLEHGTACERNTTEQVFDIPVCSLSSQTASRAWPMQSIHLHLSDFRQRCMHWQSESRKKICFPEVNFCSLWRTCGLVRWNISHNSRWSNPSTAYLSCQTWLTGMADIYIYLT